MNNVIWQNLVLLLLMNMCVWSGGSYFEHLCDSDICCLRWLTVTLTFYVYQSSNEIDAYQLVFIVSISLLDFTQNS